MATQEEEIDRVLKNSTWFEYQMQSMQVKGNITRVIVPNMLSPFPSLDMIEESHKLQNELD